uniref:Battenin n=1 Tax=Panagrellus redivivus TaxID=6233 RepID=A0A7E4UNW3_PANRE
MVAIVPAASKPTQSSLKWTLARNLIAFWIFGLCNNYGYVIMLSAAEDIMDAQENNVKNDNDTVCLGSVSDAKCSTVSTGAVLLADIIPTFFVKITFPFFMHRIPFGVRHCVVVLAMVGSFFCVAFSESVAMSLAGVALASAGSGLGEITFLAMSTHFHNSMISACTQKNAY